MDSLKIDQYVVGIYANYQGVGITLIGTDKEIDTYWVFDHIDHRKATIWVVSQKIEAGYVVQ